MRRRSLHLALGGAAAAGALHLGRSIALAGESWCDVDPPVLISLPGGHRVVYVVNGGPVEHAANLASPLTEYTVSGSEAGAKVSVQLYVTVIIVDGHSHPFASEVWTGPGRTGQRLSRREGEMTGTVRHHFTLEQ